MSYSSTKDLPANIKKLSAKKQRQFMHVFNSAMKKHGKESTAFAMANSVVNTKSKAAVKATNADIDDYVGGYELDDHRLDQQAVNYTGLTQVKDQACAICNWFVSPNRCCIVRDEISPTGLCDQYMLEPEEVDEPLLVTIAEAEASKPKPLFATLFNGLLAKAHEALNPSRVNPDLSTFSLYKVLNADDTTTLRFIAWWSNCYKDKSSIVLNTAMQKEYVAWADETKTYPNFLLWHTIDTEFATVDMIDFVDGFNIASGTILPGKEEVAYRLAEYEGGVGCSHGSLYEQDDNNKLLRFRPFELTALPVARARNSWTNFLVGTWEEEDAMGFSPEKRTFLKEVGGMTEEQIVASEASTEAMTKALKANKIEWADDSPADLIGLTDAVTKLADSLANIVEGQTALTTDVAALKADVAEAKSTATQAASTAATNLDDALANELTPRRNSSRGYVASEAADNHAEAGTAGAAKNEVFNIYEQIKSSVG